MVRKMEKDIYDLTVDHILENQEKAYRLAYSYVQDRDAALDVVQNAVCQALEKCWGIRKKTALKTWYYKIVVNEALQYLRRNRREISTRPEEMKEEAFLEEGYERSDGDGQIFARVMKLPPDMKTVVILRFYEQLSLAEIAKVTDTNLNTVKSRLYAALKKLRKSLEEMEYERA